MHFRTHRTAIAVIAGSLLCLLAGCTGASKTAKNSVFFPPAPNLPRLQYLTGISDSTDVEGKKKELSLIAFGDLTPQKSVLTIIKPSGIAAAAGKLYITDISGQLLVVDLPKKSMEQLKGNQGAGKLAKPVGVAVDRAGFVFVADVGRKEVLVYNNDGEYLKSVGGGLNITPTDVAVDDSRLYVLDTKKAVIHIFDPVTSAFVQDIGKVSDASKSLSLPTKMMLDKHGIIRVSNAGRGDITSYDRDGHFLGSFGKFGDSPGQFARPKGLTADDNGYLYVVDAGFQNVQVFDENNRLLTMFGSADLPVGGMNLPCDVTISSDDLPYYQKLADQNFELSQVIFVANQFGNPKISLYGYGKQKGIDYDKAYQQIVQQREQWAREEMQRRSKVSSQVTP
ncbi:MAG TPA: hypothetical protein DCZ75_09790 [Geobacter sp.]|nr:hypothetical protein [Geobacter sp.]